MDLISPGPPAFVCDENINQRDLEYVSDHRLEIADCRSTASSQIDDNMQNDSEVEETSHPPVSVHPSSQETIFDGGRALCDVAGYMDLNRARIDDPWNSFSSEEEFNWASWLVRSKRGKSLINVYFAEGSSGTKSKSLRSVYTMGQYMDRDVRDPSISTWCGRKPL